MSTTRMPSDRAVASFTDLVTGMLDDATHVTRVATQAYLKGIDVVVAQQKLARESSRQWASELATVQTDLGRQATRGATARAEDLVAATVESGEAVGEAGSRAKVTGRPARRTQTATTRRTSRRAATAVAAPARAAAAVADGPATWTGDGYEALSAAEVIEKLPGLSQRDLREVEAHEQAHHARQTVLQRIESLRGPEPLPGYDELTVPEVQTQLGAGDATRATAVRDYERSHKKREGVLRAVQARLDDA